MSYTELKEFFEPRALAVVGATRTPGFGYLLPRRLQEQGWGDRTFLVNPRGGEIHGLPVFRSVAELPAEVELAVVMVGAAGVPAVLEELGRRGIRRVIIESAGFAETGEEGRRRQEEMHALARGFGMRVIGPNCVGVINSANRFSTVEVLPEALTPGPLGIIAQSGIFGNVLLDGLHEEGIFISKAATLGNRMDVDESEVLEFLHADPATRVIMMYLESAADGRRLVDVLRRVSRDKPVLILKSGRTSAGQAAAASHTGSLATKSELYDAAFAQSGALRASSLAELIALARVFVSQPLPTGNRLGIITSSGSLGALAADAAVSHGLELPPPSPDLVHRLQKTAPGWMNIKNPLDVGPSGMFAAGIAAMMRDPSFDMVLAITIVPYAVIRDLIPSGITGKLWFGDLAGLPAENPTKPLVVALTGAGEFVAHMKKTAGPAVPVVTSPELAATALAGLWRYCRRRERLSAEAG